MNQTAPKPAKQESRGEMFWPQPLCFPVEFPPREQVTVPDYIRNLGVKPTQYYEVLTVLAALGNLEAKAGLDAIHRQAKKLKNSSEQAWRRAIDADSISPVELQPTARWKLDGFGILALQLLLWLWQARAHPRLYPTISGCVSRLDDFNKDSAYQWWKLGGVFLNEKFLNPGEAPSLANLIPDSCRKSALTRRNYVWKTILNRFYSFAKPSADKR